MNQPFKVNRLYAVTKRGAKYGNGRLGGYPGLEFTASQIVQFIPKCKRFVEPFSGLGRISKRVLAEEKILNDMSEYAVKKCKKFGTVTREDFVDCIKKWDSEDTIFFLDQPWRKAMYDGNQAFIDRTPKEYALEILQLMPTLKSKHWFCCIDYHEKETNNLYENSPYFKKVITSRRTILGRPARVKLISNKPFVNYHQSTLTFEGEC